MAADNDTMFIPKLPPEVLQAAWSYLPFEDLIRCQSVCKMWKSYLPGNNPFLRGILFSPDVRETVLDGPPITIWFIITQYLDVGPDHLPRMRFVIGFENPLAEWMEGDPPWHPIIAWPAHYCDLIHPSFQGADGAFEFGDFDDLKDLEEDVAFEGASWEKMLACVPKAQQLDLKLQWRISVDARYMNSKNMGSVYSWTVQNPDGVTTLDVVKLMRMAIRETTEFQLRAHCDKMVNIEGYRRK